MQAYKSSNLFSNAERKLLNEALNLVQSRFLNGEGYTDPSMVKEFVQDKYQQRLEEVTALLLLDSQHRLIYNVELEEGEGLSGSRVFREVIKANAAAVVVIYFSPTRELSHFEKASELSILKSALSLIDVSLLDCILLTDENFSLAEQGLL